MENKKVLIRIRDLKQYFPLKRNKKLFVKANDGVTLDIYEGETFGLVGESGCGKSTLGRVILQLYKQTAGDVLYYGTSVYELMPKYFVKILNTLSSPDVNAEKIKTKDEEIFNASVRAVGGFIVTRDLSKAAAAYLSLCEISKKCHELSYSMESLILRREGLDNKSEAEGINEKIIKTEAELAAVKAQIIKKETEIEDMRKSYANDADFIKYEKLRETGIDLAKLEYNEMRTLRNELQLIFQDPYSSLNPRMTVGQIIGEGLKAHNFFDNEGTAYNSYITNKMNECGLAPYMIHRYPHQFSGGQRQRIGIARSLAVKPKFVVCDEAVSALDVSIQSQILNLLQDLKDKENLTYLFISHDLSVIKYLSDRIGVMYLGNLVELATTKDLFENPSHPYTEALLTAIPTTDSNESISERTLLEGDIPSPINPPKGCKFHTRCRYAQDVCKKDEPGFYEVSENHFAACHLRSGVISGR